MITKKNTRTEPLLLGAAQLGDTPKQLRDWKYMAERVHLRLESTPSCDMQRRFVAFKTPAPGRDSRDVICTEE